MTTSAASPERSTLDRLRDDFQAKGYQFIIQPHRDQVPEFLGAHRPDAIAIGQNDKVIIEVTRPNSRHGSVKRARLDQDAVSQSGWRYLLVYVGQDPSELVALSRPLKSQVDQAIQELHSLEQSGHLRAAMVEGWALLEALARRLYKEDIRVSLEPLTPMEVVERLAMDGQIDDRQAKRLRALSSFRNYLVHGDLNVSVKPADVRYLLERIEDINSRLTH